MKNDEKVSERLISPVPAISYRKRLSQLQLNSMKFATGKESDRGRTEAFLPLPGHLNGKNFFLISRMHGGPSRRYAGEKKVQFSGSRRS